VRYSAWCLAVSSLACVSTSQAQVDGTNAHDRPAQSDLAAADWKKNLTIGPNGPIPAIVVDQFGYLAKSKKVAVIRAPQVGYDGSARFAPGKSYSLIELPTGKVVKTAPPTVWNGGNTDPASGDKAWWFDFSQIEAPGKYAVVDLEKGIRSADISIGDHVYKDVMKHALRVYFYQRAGFEKKPEFAGRAWADRASHLGRGRDPESRPWHEGRPPNPAAKSLIKDLRGGWYDAGDFNKYTSWAARYIIILLHAYDEHPQAFSDDYGIPESGSGQQEMSATDRLRARFEASTYLFEMTGEAQFKWFADAHYGALLPPWGPSMWEVDALESALYYARLPGATPEVAKSIRERFLANLSRASEAFQGSLQQGDPYRAPIKDYTWGSNKGKAMQARLYQLVALYNTDPRLSKTSLAAALEYAHYIHGVNPLGLVYLTNMAPAGASHSATTMFHAWFAHGTRWQQVTEQLPGPPPGLRRT
jgi:Glycosyl hydrolase family 9/Cellulase N-terminal ig-like domain